MMISFPLCASAIGGDIMFSYISSERSSGIRRSSGSPERCSRPPRTTRGREASIYHRHRDRIAVSVRRYVLTCGNAPVNQSKLRTQICLIEDQSRSEEHTSELQSLMRISYAVFCLKKKKKKTKKVNK